MKKINTIFALGILTALFPFLGFPGFVKVIAVLIFGIAISAISGVMIIDYKVKNQAALGSKQEEDIFMDNKEDFLKKDLENKAVEDGDIKIEQKEV